MLQGTTHLDIHSRTFGYHDNLLLTAVDMRWHVVCVYLFVYLIIHSGNLTVLALNGWKSGRE